MRASSPRPKRASACRRRSSWRSRASRPTGAASPATTACWQRGMPTHFDVRPPLDPAARATLLAPDILPTFSAAEMIALGAELPDAARAFVGPLALVMLENADAPPTFIAGTPNFYVVT